MAKFANTKGLSKQEKFMIQGMIIEDNSVEDIAKYLDREMELVETFIEDFKPEVKPVETQEVPVQHPTRHVINKTGMITKIMYLSISMFLKIKENKIGNT